MDLPFRRHTSAQKGASQSKPPRLRWSVPDLIDFDYYVAEDEQRSREQPSERKRLAERDRRLYKDEIAPVIGDAGTHTTTHRSRALRWWLELRRRQEDPALAELLPGTAFERGQRLVTYAMGLLGFAIGIGVASALLDYDGQTPVNVSWYLFWLVLLQLLLVGTTLTLWYGRRSRVVRGAARDISIIGYLIRPLFSRAARWVQQQRLAHVSPDLRERASARQGMIQSRYALYGPAAYLPMLIPAQVFGIGFNLGAILVTIALEWFTDLAFGWGSALNISAGAVHGLTQFIALPWSWLFGEGAGLPTLEQVAGTRISLKDPLFVLDAENLRSWRWFLVLAVFTYGLLPRVVLLGLSAHKTRRALAALPFTHQSAQAPYARMITPSVVIGAARTGVGPEMPIPSPLKPLTSPTAAPRPPKPAGRITTVPAPPTVAEASGTELAERRAAETAKIKPEPTQTARTSDRAAAPAEPASAPPPQGEALAKASARTDQGDRAAPQLKSKPTEPPQPSGAQPSTQSSIQPSARSGGEPARQADANTATEPTSQPKATPTPTERKAPSEDQEREAKAQSGAKSTRRQTPDKAAERAATEQAITEPPAQAADSQTPPPSHPTTPREPADRPAPAEPADEPTAGVPQPEQATAQTAAGPAPTARVPQAPPVREQVPEQVPKQAPEQAARGAEPTAPEGQPVPAEAVPTKPAVSVDPDACVLLLHIDVSDMLEERDHARLQQLLLQQSGWRVAAAATFGGGRAMGEQATDLIESADWHAPPPRVALIQDGSQPPITENLRFIRSVRAAAGEQAQILLALIGDPDDTEDDPLPPLSDFDFTDWQRKIEQMGDPYLRLVMLANADDGGQ